MFLETLSEVAYNIILPLFLLVIIVMVVDRVFDIDPRPLSRLVVYLFTPFLIFQRLATTALTAGETGEIMGVAIAMCLLVALAATLIARWMKLDPRTSAAFVLSATLINAGNYGIPLNRFAFGDAGEERAVVFFVGTVVITYTVGVFLASRGTVSTTAALLNVFRVPMLYGVVAGLIINLTNVNLPTPVERTSELLAQAAVPAMLVVLGLQLRRARLRNQIKPILVASGLRLGLAPVIGLALALLLGMTGLTRQVVIVQSGMPTAVIASILAMEFGADTEFVTGAILVDTLLSMVTLSIILTIVM